MANHNMTLQYIFSKSYLFDPQPPSESQLYWYLIAFFGVLILIAIISLFAKGMDEKIRKKQIYCYLVVGILGFIYLFARHEELIWLGSRLFLSLISVAFLVWVTYILVFMVRYLPKKSTSKKATERFEKYLPKRRQ